MSENENSADPFRVWRSWFQENEQRWSEAMSQLLGDDRFAKAAGRSVQEAMHAQRMFSESMAQYLGNLNLPSRSDILALGDRIGQLEDAIASLQAEVRNLRKSGVSRGQVKKPKRTRKPPEEDGDGES